jgi:hypothetical protein
LERLNPDTCGFLVVSSQATHAAFTFFTMVVDEEIGCYIERGGIWS